MTAEIPLRRLPVAQWKVLVAVLVTLIAAGGIVQLADGSLRSAGLVERPEHFVAASFTTPSTLPTTAVAGQNLTVSFALSSSAADPQTVPWELITTTTSATAHPRIVARGDEPVAAHGSSTIETGFGVPVGETPLTIKVVLPGLALAPLQFTVTVRQPIVHQRHPAQNKRVLTPGGR